MTEQRVSFYFSAHEDDWQLFMNPFAFRDVRDGAKTVFVHVTAGDAGLGTTNGGRKHPYYLAREQGAESAIVFMADAEEHARDDKRTVSVAINGHPMRRVSYRNTIAYFLRLPDGSTDGGGYADTGYQSLKLLAEGKIKTIAAIDQSTTYRSWNELVVTVRALIERERGQNTSLDMHIPELDPALNPNDHPDHVMTAKLALEAAHSLKARRIHHPGYMCGVRPENLSGYDRDMKCAVYAVTLAAIQALDHSTNWQHYDQSFVARDYFRVENSTV
jgi:GlcNAc-PI de-N-acetylase